MDDDVGRLPMEGEGFRATGVGRAPGLMGQRSCPCSEENGSKPGSNAGNHRARARSGAIVGRRAGNSIWIADACDQRAVAGIRSSWLTGRVDQSHITPHVPTPYDQGSWCRPVHGRRTHMQRSHVLEFLAGMIAKDEPRRVSQRWRCEKANSRRLGSVVTALRRSYDV